MKKLIVLFVSLLSTVACADEYDVANNLIDSTENIIITGMKTSSATIVILSSDIGKMADRIGIMADRIGVMADRIVFTENMLATLAHKLIDPTLQPVVSTPVPQFPAPQR